MTGPRQVWSPFSSPSRTRDSGGLAGPGSLKTKIGLQTALGSLRTKPPGVYTHVDQRRLEYDIPIEARTPRPVVVIKP